MWAMILMAQVAAAPAPMPIFLAGCREQRDKDKWTEECWTSPRGGLMIGSGRSGQGETVTSWEYMRIERGADGGLSFYGSPKGAPAVEFKATAVTANEVTFVNPSHDFPQRLRYTRTASGVDAEVSLADGTKPMRWSYRTHGRPTAK